MIKFVKNIEIFNLRWKELVSTVGKNPKLKKNSNIYKFDSDIVNRSFLRCL